jgi:hypothetical protein
MKKIKTIFTTPIYIGIKLTPLGLVITIVFKKYYKPTWC